MKKILLKSYSLLSKLLFAVIFCIFLVIGGALLPIPGNYKLYSVSTGSMSPIISAGSLVLVKPQPDYKTKDIVTFKTQKPTETITHRIVIKRQVDNQIQYLTKGDANKSKDTEILLKQNIIGKVLFSVPFVGNIVSYSKTLQGLVILIIIPATLLIYSEIINIKNETIRLIKERKTRKLTTFEKVEEKVGEEIIAVEKEIKKDIGKITKRKKY